MIRIAGRGEDGTAKAIKTDNNGRIQLFRGNVLIHEELLKTPIGESVIIDLGDLPYKQVRVSIHGSANRELTVELLHYSKERYFAEHMMDVSGSQLQNVGTDWYETKTNKTSIKITNTGSSDLYHTISIYGRV